MGREAKGVRMRQRSTQDVEAACTPCGQRWTINMTGWFRLDAPLQFSQTHFVFRRVCRVAFAALGYVQRNEPFLDEGSPRVKCTRCSTKHEAVSNRLYIAILAMFGKTTLVRPLGHQQNIVDDRRGQTIIFTLWTNNSTSTCDDGSR